jgi:hypothetical protein
MPRQARIDAPGALHHIITRGIERKKFAADTNQRLKKQGLISIKELWVNIH